MGRYFTHLTEEDEKRICKDLVEKYGGMTLHELDVAFRGKDADKGLQSHTELQMLTGELEHKIRYVDPLPVDFDYKEQRKQALLNDEAGHFDFNQPSLKWDIKPKTMPEGKQIVQETEATVLLNRLCHIDDVAHGNKHVSRDVKIRLFGIEPQDPEPDTKVDTPEAWFAIVNTKLDSIQKALRETSDNMERINGGTSF